MKKWGRRGGRGGLLHVTFQVTVSNWPPSTCSIDSGEGRRSAPILNPLLIGDDNHNIMMKAI